MKPIAVSPSVYSTPCIKNPKWVTIRCTAAPLVLGGGVGGTAGWSPSGAGDRTDLRRLRCVALHHRADGGLPELGPVAVGEDLLQERVDEGLGAGLLVQADAVGVDGERVAADDLDGR